MNPIRVLLADDHTLIRAGLRMVVSSQPGFTVVGEANDGREAVALAEQLKPDVVVMDIGMPLVRDRRVAAAAVPVGIGPARWSWSAPAHLFCAW